MKLLPSKIQKTLKHHRLLFFWFRKNSIILSHTSFSWVILFRFLFASNVSSHCRFFFYFYMHLIFISSLVVQINMDYYCDVSDKMKKIKRISKHLQNLTRNEIGKRIQENAKSKISISLIQMNYLTIISPIKIKFSIYI